MTQLSDSYLSVNALLKIKESGLSSSLVDQIDQSSTSSNFDLDIQKLNLLRYFMGTSYFIANEGELIQKKSVLTQAFELRGQFMVQPLTQISRNIYIVLITTLCDHDHGIAYITICNISRKESRITDKIYNDFSFSLVPESIAAMVLVPHITDQLLKDFGQGKWHNMIKLLDLLHRIPISNIVKMISRFYELGDPDSFDYNLDLLSLSHCYYGMWVYNRVPVNSFTSLTIHDYVRTRYRQWEYLGTEAKYNDRSVIDTQECYSPYRYMYVFRFLKRFDLCIYKDSFKSEPKGKWTSSKLKSINLSQFRILKRKKIIFESFYDNDVSNIIIDNTPTLIEYRLGTSYFKITYSPISSSFTLEVSMFGREFSEEELSFTDLSELIIITGRLIKDSRSRVERDKLNSTLILSTRCSTELLILLLAADILVDQLPDCTFNRSKLFKSIIER